MYTWSLFCRKHTGKLSQVCLRAPQLITHMFAEEGELRGGSWKAFGQE